MELQCMLPFCNSRGFIPGIYYFRVTADRHDDWMKAIGRDTTREYFVTGNRICSNHFLPEDLFKTSLGINVKKGAVPTINLSPRVVPQAQLSGIPKPNLTNLNPQPKKNASAITRNTLMNNTKKIKTIKLENKSLQKKINKTKDLLEALGDKCDISKISQQLIDAPSNVPTKAEESGSESDTEATQEFQSESIKIEIVHDNDTVSNSNYVSAIERNNQEVIMDDDDDMEEQNTEIDCLNMEGQVQITFSPGNDTAKIELLKKKLKQLAENDVIKSKKIRELNNIIFIKNKVIDELRAEIAKLNEEQIHQNNMPMFKIRDTNTIE